MWTPLIALLLSAVVFELVYSLSTNFLAFSSHLWTFRLDLKTTRTCSQRHRQQLAIFLVVCCLPRRPGKEYRDHSAWKRPLVPQVSLFPELISASNLDAAWLWCCVLRSISNVWRYVFAHFAVERSFSLMYSIPSQALCSFELITCMTCWHLLVYWLMLSCYDVTGGADAEAGCGGSCSCSGESSTASQM